MYSSIFTKITRKNNNHIIRKNQTKETIKIKQYLKMSSNTGDFILELVDQIPTKNPILLNHSQWYNL